MIQLLIDGNLKDFTTVIFPDGTSQVWKIEADPAEYDYNTSVCIRWLYESEAEVLHICQLAQLLCKMYKPIPYISAPFLPYGRQDKEIGNMSTFSRKTVEMLLLNSGISHIETIDAHSTSNFVESFIPIKFFEQFADKVICFPDQGAKDRYSECFPNSVVIYCEKTRDVSTGEITGLNVLGDVDLIGQHVVIVDDICDGGATFIYTAKALDALCPAQIDLAVTHGLFSKGQQVLYDAGITKIYTTNSLLRNPKGFVVW